MPLVLALGCSAEPFARGGDATDAGGTDSVSAGSAPQAGMPAQAGSGNGSAGTIQSGEAGAPALSGGSGGSLPGSGGSGPANATCPALPGAKLVLAGSFCIDETEVTAAQYQVFLQSGPSVLEQPYECLGNMSFQHGCEFTDPGKQPVRCVDWCDARAYCERVGKHLCGSSEGAGTAMPYDAPATAPESQWYMACSHGGEVAYPYGDAYDDSACWGADRPAAGVVGVKSASDCVGGYEGLWDMSGGVAEWVDSCNAEKGMSDACHIRGGSYTGTADQLRCDWQSATPRDTSSNYIGIRCCADLVP
jgi:sulfatase modifying factor 1